MGVKQLCCCRRGAIHAWTFACVIRRALQNLFSMRVIGWQNMAWVEGLKGILQPLSSGSYVNYIDPFMQGGCGV